MGKFFWRSAFCLTIASLFTAVTPGLVAADDSDMGEFETVNVQFAQPVGIEEILELVRTADADHPVVVKFRQGEWSGETILGSASVDARLDFLSELSERGDILDQVVGVVGAIDPNEVGGTLPEASVHEVHENPTLATNSAPSTHGNALSSVTGEPPFVPQSGRFRQSRADWGWVEVTNHTFTGLGAYPVELPYCEGSFVVLCARPTYAALHR